MCFFGNFARVLGIEWKFSEHCIQIHRRVSLVYTHMRIYGCKSEYVCVCNAKERWIPKILCLVFLIALISFLSLCSKLQFGSNYANFGLNNESKLVGRVQSISF